MSNKIIALTVALERDIPEDDCQDIINAIKMVKGVSAVAVKKTDASYYSALERTKLEIKNKLLEILW